MKREETPNKVNKTQQNKCYFFPLLPGPGSWLPSEFLHGSSCRKINRGFLRNQRIVKLFTPSGKSILRLALKWSLVNFDCRRHRWYISRAQHPVNGQSKFLRMASFSPSLSLSKAYVISFRCCCRFFGCGNWHAKSCTIYVRSEEINWNFWNRIPLFPCCISFIFFTRLDSHKIGFAFTILILSTVPVARMENKKMRKKWKEKKNTFVCKRLIAFWFAHTPCIHISSLLFPSNCRALLACWSVSITIGLETKQG